MSFASAWRWEQFIGTIGLIAFFGYWVWRRVHPIAGLMIGWVLLSAAFVFQNPIVNFGPYQFEMNVVSARAFVAAILIVFFVTEASMDYIAKALKALDVLVILNSFLIIVNGYGLLNNTAFDSAFVAMAYPLVVFREQQANLVERKWKNWKKFVWPAVGTLLPLFALRQSTAFFCLAAGMGTYFVLKKRFKWAPIMLFLALAAGLVWNKDSYFDDRGRFVRWGQFMHMLEVIEGQTFGVGSGTVERIGHKLHAVHADKNPDFYLFMHNEYLQVFFEQGMVGLVLMVALIVACLVRSFSTPWLFATNCAVLVCFLTQFPLRFFITQVFIAILVRLSLIRKDVKCLSQY